MDYSLFLNNSDSDSDSDNEFNTEINNINSIKYTYNNPSHIILATITASLRLNTEINTEILGDNMEINKYILGFKYLKNRTIIKKGITKKKDLSNVKKTKFVKEKNFNHCITVLLNLTPDLDNESIINLKICKNGSLQMTGCKEISHLDICADIIINLINNIPDLIDSPILKSNISNKTIHLMKANFRLNFPIKRENIQDIFNKPQYAELVNKHKINVKYESGHYPGVNIKYTTNVNCNHTTHETNAKSKYLCDCRTITIVLFQSGNVNITAAITWEQVIDAYTFINKIIKENFNEILQKPIADIIDLHLNNNIKVNEVCIMNNKNLFILNDSDFENYNN